MIFSNSFVLEEFSDWFSNMDSEDLKVVLALVIKRQCKLTDEYCDNEGLPRVCKYCNMRSYHCRPIYEYIKPYETSNEPE